LFGKYIEALRIKRATQNWMQGKYGGMDSSDPTQAICAVEDAKSKDAGSSDSIDSFLSVQASTGFN
jgi:hypothetical protein